MANSHQWEAIYIFQKKSKGFENKTTVVFHSKTVLEPCWYALYTSNSLWSQIIRNIEVKEIILKLTLWKDLIYIIHCIRVYNSYRRHFLIRVNLSWLCFPVFEPFIKCNFNNFYVVLFHEIVELNVVEGKRLFSKKIKMGQLLFVKAPKTKKIYTTYSS